MMMRGMVMEREDGYIAIYTNKIKPTTKTAGGCAENGSAHRITYLHSVPHLVCGKLIKFSNRNISFVAFARR